MPLAVYLERGKAKVFACAVDWPGWCRSGRTDDAALEALDEYAPRYRAVVGTAGLKWPRGASSLDVVETVAGSGATDFGVPERECSADRRPLTAADARRLAAIVGASWSTLDAVVASSSANLRKGPRGGGRDRDEIAEHVAESERSYVRKVGLRYPPAQGAEVRPGFLAALTAARDPLPEITTGAKAWPWRYAARRVAWHALDHAWEIEDKREP